MTTTWGWCSGERPGAPRRTGSSVTSVCGGRPARMARRSSTVRIVRPASVFAFACPSVPGSEVGLCGEGVIARSLPLNAETRLSWRTAGSSRNAGLPLSVARGCDDLKQVDARRKAVAREVGRPFCGACGTSAGIGVAVRAATLSAIPPLGPGMSADSQEVDELVGGVDDGGGQVVGLDVAARQPGVGVAVAGGVRQLGTGEGFAADEFERATQVRGAGRSASFAAGA